MGRWYVLSAVSGREQEAAELLKRKISRGCWQECRVLKKIKTFRSGGVLHLIEDVMFPGYLLVKTDTPEKLVRELQRSKEFPKPLSSSGEKRNLNPENIIPLESKDLRFLKSVCGENLESPMGITRIALSGDKQIVRAEGVLSGYLNQIVKLNLHKRFAVIEVELFNRKQAVLFGVRLECDQAG